MKSKLYKLAIRYISKCNAEWNKRKLADDLKSLDRLTYWNFGKYMLVYGADAEWQKFSRYEVLDNAIQKLAKYENEEQEIKNKVIDEFVERLKDLIAKNVEDAESSNDLCCEIFQSEIDEIAEQMRSERNGI